MWYVCCVCVKQTTKKLYIYIECVSSIFTKKVEECSLSLFSIFVFLNCFCAMMALQHLLFPKNRLLLTVLLSMLLIFSICNPKTFFAHFELHHSTYSIRVTWLWFIRLEWQCDWVYKVSKIQIKRKWESNILSPSCRAKKTNCLTIHVTYKEHQCGCKSNEISQCQCQFER